MTKKHTPGMVEQVVIPLLRFFVEIFGRLANWFIMTFIPIFSRYVWGNAFNFSEYLVTWYESKQGPVEIQTREACKYCISSTIFAIVVIVLVKIF